MSDFWLNAIRKYEHEFFPERFDNNKLVHALRDETMPADTRARIADELLSRPTFNADNTIRDLGVEWWGDDPMGCRRAWESLESAKKRANR